jgi:hypothetical protein
MGSYPPHRNYWDLATCLLHICLMSPQGAVTDTSYLVHSAAFLTLTQEFWCGTDRPTNGKFLDLRVPGDQSAPIQATP